MYTESDLLMISGLQHLIFCERQWALIHLEQVWDENRLTVEGRQLHERVDEPEHETRGGVRVVRALPLRSLQYGLSGRADVVEFHFSGEGAVPGRGAGLMEALAEGGPTVGQEAVQALVKVFPVEYKRGKPKSNRCDEVQLCAQALCLEEMLGVVVGEGALYYGRPRRRHEVVFDEGLRGLTIGAAERMHGLYAAGATPRAVFEKKCENCSLLEKCLPRAIGVRRSARAWVDGCVAEVVSDCGVEGMGAD